jgi:hypothetical protein
MTSDLSIAPAGLSDQAVMSSRRTIASQPMRLLSRGRCSAMKRSAILAKACSSSRLR